MLRCSCRSCALLLWRALASSCAGTMILAPPLASWRLQVLGKDVPYAYVIGTGRRGRACRRSCEVCVLRASWLWPVAFRHTPAAPQVWHVLGLTPSAFAHLLAAKARDPSCASRCCGCAPGRGRTLTQPHAHAQRQPRPPTHTAALPLQPWLWGWAPTPTKLWWWQRKACGPSPRRSRAIPTSRASGERRASASGCPVCARRRRRHMPLSRACRSLLHAAVITCLGSHASLPPPRQYDLP